MSDPSPQPPIPEVDDADRVVGLIARLPHGSLVRRMALQVVQGRPLDSIRPLLTSLTRSGVRHWRERQAAAWSLGHTAIAEEDREAVASLLLDTVEGVHSEGWISRFLRGAFLTSCMTFGFYLFFSIVGDIRVRDYYETLLVLSVMHLLFAPGGLLLAFWHSRITETRVRAEAARSLGRSGSVEAIGTLASALRDANPSVRSAAAWSLHRLLPLVTDAHYGAFGTDSIECLGRALYHPDNQLTFKVLAALEKVGTPAAIPFVERACHRGRTHRIREAAETVLRTLNERKHRETQRDRLLRPTDGLHDSAVLLRQPVPSEEDASLYLRASSDGA